MLKNSAHRIAEAIPSGSMIIELGSGSVAISESGQFLATNEQQ